MTLCADRGLDIEGTGLYPIAMHNAALADVIVTQLRSGAFWERPADKALQSTIWQSAAFLDPSSVRLHRVVLVDRWHDERQNAERYSWRSLGEQAVYELPMTLHVVIIGQRRDGKHHSPWSRGYLHPRSRHLRIRSKTGVGFGKFSGVWREECAWISRDKWLDTMREDGAMREVCFDVEQPVPPPEMLSKIRQLAEKRLKQIERTKETPPMQPSVCFWPTPCAFASECWNWREPSEKTGFIHLAKI